MRLKAAHLRRFNGILTLVWLALVLPSVLLWRDSITWVVLMSVWANVAGHFGAWMAARAEQASESDEQVS